jgi:hypothetical protein
MWSIKEDTEGGIREFLREQAALPGKGTVSLYQFDDKYDKVWDFESPEFASSVGYTLVPRGWTALLDAVGKAVTETGEELAAMDEQDRPGQVVVVIATDGEENRSTEYTLERVKELVTQQQETYGWKFTYVGANVDAFANGAALGIGNKMSLSYASTPVGTRNAWRGTAAAVGRSVLENTSISYTDQERDEAKDN